MHRLMEHKQRVYDWMVASYDSIAARIPATYLAYLPWYGSGCSSERLAAARKFFADPKHSAMGTDIELAKVSDQITECVSLQRRESAAVARYLGTMAAAMRSDRSGLSP
jgi:hypothetical protein